MGIADSKILAESLLSACQIAEREGKDRLDETRFWKDEVSPFNPRCHDTESESNRISSKPQRKSTNTFHETYVRIPVNLLLKKPLHVPGT